MRYQIQLEDRMLVDEFRQNPYGRHSPGLLRILNRMRCVPLDGKYVLVCTKPFREWKLAVHGNRQRPIEILHDHVFTSREEAEWAVFKLRWKALTGEELN